jgi:hypothetical protein
MRIGIYMNPKRVIGRRVILTKYHPWALEKGKVKSCHEGVMMYMVDLDNGVTCGVSHPEDVKFIYNAKK